jgi:outer membrane protein assembly factor BamE (lipoprotein component of BamABCDE complex)
MSLKRRFILGAVAAVGFAGCLLTLTSACSFHNAQPRTVEAAKAKFDDGEFEIGSTTKSEVRAKLGSPSSTEKLDQGRETWTYLKTETVGMFTVTTDTGTNYVARYTFDDNGVLEDREYRAEPAGNPLTAGHGL